MRYLLDTNICIYIARARPAAVLERFRRLRPGDVGMSVITYGELTYGSAKSQRSAAAKAALRELASIIIVLPIDEAAGHQYGVVRAELEREERPIGNNELWIAAHAKALSVTLVTNNEGEFRRVKGLSVENWAASPN